MKNQKYQRVHVRDNLMDYVPKWVGLYMAVIAKNSNKKDCTGEIFSVPLFEENKTLYSNHVMCNNEIQ